MNEKLRFQFFDVSQPFFSAVHLYLANGKFNVTECVTESVTHILKERVTESVTENCDRKSPTNFLNIKYVNRRDAKPLVRPEACFRYTIKFQICLFVCLFI